MASGFRITTAGAKYDLTDVAGNIASDGVLQETFVTLIEASGLLGRTGPTGPVGANSNTGTTGPTGSVGPTGPLGITTTSFNTTVVGLWDDPIPITLNITKLSSTHAIMDFPLINTVSNNVATADIDITSIPAGFAPQDNWSQSFPIINQNQVQAGLITVDNIVLVITKDTGADYGGSGLLAGFLAQSFVYRLA